MSKITALTALFGLLILQSCGGGSSDNESADLEQKVPETPEEELVQAMDLAVELAESDSIMALFRQFTPPEDFARLEQTGQLEVAVKRFSIFRHDFVRALREAQALQPAFNEDTTRAVYEVVEVEVPGHKVAFRKIGEDWYFSD